MGVGLFVLYSASDGSEGTLLRQLRNYGIALAGLLVATTPGDPSGVLNPDSLNPFSVW